MKKEGMGNAFENIIKFAGIRGCSFSLNWSESEDVIYYPKLTGLGEPEFTMKRCADLDYFLEAAIKFYNEHDERLKKGNPNELQR